MQRRARLCRSMPFVCIRLSVCLSVNISSETWEIKVSVIIGGMLSLAGFLPRDALLCRAFCMSYVCLSVCKMLVD